MTVSPLKVLFLATTVLAVNFTATAQGQPEEPQTAVVGALDKITARITELQLPLGRRVKFGTLWIAARFCYSRPPEETPETYIFLEIDDVLADGAEVRVFTGWMLASSPALNALEHAVYDVWAISCKTSSAGAASGSE
ncbi:MAG: DUF2155 domain-containing protein [Proteobacteria bacterium]|nr:DUF2155 domain-containing protein [Pseudomonadota bacterium]